MISNKTYDIFKKITLWLPIIATLYFTLSEIWGFVYVDKVLRTFVAVDAALNAFLALSSVKYKKINLDNTKGGEKIDE